jgi:hypothetical protein
MAVLQMLSTPLFCLLAATAEAAEARQVMSALRSAPPQLVVRSSNRQQHAAASPAAAAAAPAWQPLTGVSSAQVPLSSRDQPSSATAARPDSSDACFVEAAVATSVAAFAPQLSVPLTLGLQYTNSGVLTAVCLFWAAVLWPRWGRGLMCIVCICCMQAACLLVSVMP